MGQFYETINHAISLFVRYILKYFKYLELKSINYLTHVGGIEKLQAFDNTK